MQQSIDIRSGPTATNPPYAAAAGKWERQTVTTLWRYTNLFIIIIIIVGHRTVRYVTYADPALHASSADKVKYSVYIVLPCGMQQSDDDGRNDEVVGAETPPASEHHQARHLDTPCRFTIPDHPASAST